MKKSNSLDKLLGAAETENKPQEKKSYVDERIWKPVMDKTGNGFAIIRFLPAPDGEELPWAKLWNHAFQGPTGQWYIENSLTTIGQNDPVSELNTKFWNSGVESDKEIARKQKRKLQYYSNIYVVKDGANPQNEGKVFLYRYGKKIFDKVMETMQPAFEDETPVNPFDLWKGANFKLKLRKVDGYWNYDKSEFASPTPLAGGDDAAIEAIWKQQYSLTAFTDPSNFKTFEELEARLNSVLNTKPAPRHDAETEELDAEESPQAWGSEVTDFRKKAVAATPAKDDSEVMNYFASLASEEE